MERFDIGTVDNWDVPVYLWLREARGDRCRSKSDFAVQLPTHSVGIVNLSLCFRVVQCNGYSDHEPRHEHTHGLGSLGILDMGVEGNLMDNLRTRVSCNFTCEDTRPLIFQKIVFRWVWKKLPFLSPANSNSL